MQKQKRHGKITQKDLSSLEKFKSWLKKNIGIYKFERDISNQDLLIYFDYIENKIREFKKDDSKLFWLKLIRSLRKRFEVMKDLEKE